MNVIMLKDYGKKKAGTLCNVTNAHGKWLIRAGFAKYEGDGQVPNAKPEANKSEPHIAAEEEE
jgi:hypothetical protein